MGRDRTRIERLEQLNNSSTVFDVTGTPPVVVTTPSVGVRNVAVPNLSGTNTGDQTITLTGDVTGSGTASFATTIANSAVTNAKLANMAAHTVKANITGSSAAPVDSSLSAILDAEVGSTPGTLAMRGASLWSALAPPSVVGYVPVWQGGSLIVWGPAESTGNAFSWPILFTSYGATAGGAYEFTDISTLWKDTAGTTSVTTTGDLIARVDDKSGLGHNFTQATSGNRPTYFVDQQGFGSAHFASATPCWMDGSGLNCDQVTCWQAYVSKSAAGGRILDTRGTGAVGTVKGWYMAAGDGGGTNLFHIDDGAGNYLFDDPQTFLANNISVTIAQYVKGNATIFSKAFMKGGDGTVYVGTNALKGITPGSVSSAATCRMGAPSNSTASQTLNGYLYACGSIGAVLTATDRDRVVTHLRNLATSI